MFIMNPKLEETMVHFCIPVACEQAIPFFSLTKARICIDAYLTLSSSKVALITSLDRSNEVVLKDRKADPTWVIVAKIISYVVLPPLALLALFAKWIIRTNSPLQLRPAEAPNPPPQTAEKVEAVEVDARVEVDPSLQLGP